MLLLASVPTEQWLWPCRTASESAPIPDAGALSASRAISAAPPKSPEESRLSPDSTSSPCSHTACGAEIWWKIASSGLTARTVIVSAASQAYPPVRRQRVEITFRGREQPTRMNVFLGVFGKRVYVKRVRRMGCSSGGRPPSSSSRPSESPTSTGCRVRVALA
jgi:hypothetical protein